MIGMSFSAFFVLLVAGVLAAAVVHYIAGYRVLEGLDGFLGKVMVGWVGAWLGSPVIGHWFESLKIANIYLIPALLGAFGGTFAMVATAKAVSKAIASSIASGATSYEGKKAA